MRDRVRRPIGIRAQYAYMHIKRNEYKKTSRLSDAKGRACNTHHGVTHQEERNVAGSFTFGPLHPPLDIGQLLGPGRL